MDDSSFTDPVRHKGVLLGRVLLKPFRFCFGYDPVERELFRPYNRCYSRLASEDTLPNRKNKKRSSPPPLDETRSCSQCIRKKLTGVSWHRFTLGEAADRAHQHGF